MPYPLAASDEGITGTVFLSFVVERDEKITAIAMLRGFGGGCAKEAV